MPTAMFLNVGEHGSARDERRKAFETGSFSDMDTNQDGYLSSSEYSQGSTSTERNSRDPDSSTINRGRDTDSSTR